MRLFCAAFLLAFCLPARAQEDPRPLLFREARSWRCVVDVRSLSVEPPGGAGREQQTEHVELVLRTRPPARMAGRHRLPFEIEKASGTYSLSVDLKEPGKQSGTSVVTRGGGKGDLYPQAEGSAGCEGVDVSLTLAASPEELVAPTMLSGVEDGRFQTFRTITQRKPFLRELKIEGRLGEDGVLRGSRRFTDRHARLKRDVTITWRLERIDPALKGRVIDAQGHVVAGLEVTGWTTNPARVRNRLPPIRVKGKTDASGRFKIPVFPAFWHLEVVGEKRRTKKGTLVISGAEPKGFAVTFDSVPGNEIRVDVYRLADLPRPELLDGYFQGDVKRYLAYLAARVPAAALQRARAK